MQLTEKHYVILKRGFSLSAREFEYVKLFFEGINDNQELADRAGNTLLTAKIHISHIFNKFKVSHKLAVVIKIIDELKLLNFDIKDPTESLISKFQQKYNLTNREIDLLKIICKGYIANKDIGKQMNIPFLSSKNYLMIIYKKTFTNSKLTLFLKFIEGL
jgi:DNA-binding CsgD family transcriptional regulator